jgi:hypothetical protein
MISPIRGDLTGFRVQALPDTQTGNFPKPDIARTRGLAARTGRLAAASPSGEAAMSSQPTAPVIPSLTRPAVRAACGRRIRSSGGLALGTDVDDTTL